MDAPIAPPDTTSPPFVNPSTGFPIAVVIAVGFLVTALILLGYYFLVIRCWLRGGGGGAGSSLLHRSRGGDLADRISAVFFADYEADDGAGGLDQDVISALPVVKYRRSGKSVQECAVCISEFQPGENLKLLPSCSHAFHMDCIDTWLHHNVSCPLCRTTVTSTASLVLARLPHASQELVGDRPKDVARMGHGNSSCRFLKHERSGVAQQEPIRRSLSMDCFVGDRKPQKEPANSEAGPSRTDVGSSDIGNGGGGGETSGRFRRLLSSFGLGRSSRSTVLPIHLDP